MKHSWIVKPGKKIRLQDYDPGATGHFSDESEATLETQSYIERLVDQQRLLYASNRFSVLIILQGTDASGKDGTIRHVMSGMNPLGVKVKSFKAPNAEELEHDYLWRVHVETPRRGEVAIFNRSHYEDVLVPRVHNLVPKSEWKKRYQQINDFERMLSENHTVILKFFLHISKDEQKRRLIERLEDPKKHWKFSEGDLVDRRLWRDYQKAYEAMLNECSTPWAPWTIVPADNKWFRNLIVAQRFTGALQELKMDYPKPHFDLKKITIT